MATLQFIHVGDKTTSGPVISLSGLPAPDTPVLYKGQPGLTRHSFHSKAEPIQTLVEIYRYGDRKNYVGFVDSSKVTPA